MGGGDRGAGHVACVDHEEGRREEGHGVPEGVDGVPEEVDEVPEGVDGVPAEGVHEAPEEEARGAPDLEVAGDRGRVVVVDGLAFYNISNDSD